MLWFIVLTMVMNNGDVFTEIRPATAPEYNTEQQCNEVGKVLVDQKQIEIGTNAGKAYFICHNLTLEEIKRVFNKSGSNL